MVSGKHVFELGNHSPGAKASVSYGQIVKKSSQNFLKYDLEPVYSYGDKEELGLKLKYRYLRDGHPSTEDEKRFQTFIMVVN